MAHINVPNTHKKIYIKHEKESFHADVYEKFRDDKKYLPLKGKSDC